MLTPDLTLFRLLKLQTDSWLSSNEKPQDELQFSKQCLHSNSDSHGLLCHVTGTDRAAVVFVSTRAPANGKGAKVERRRSDASLARFLGREARFHDVMRV